MQPDYLILDEPLAGLDPVGKKKMLQILRALHRDAGITVVVVSHDADAVVEDAEQVLYLRDGKILEQGAPSDVFYRLWLNEMEHVMRDMGLELNRKQTGDTDSERLPGEILSEALCELPVLSLIHIFISSRCKGRCDRDRDEYQGSLHQEQFYNK